MVTIKIKTDNAAFEGRTRAELAEILRKLADNLDYGEFPLADDVKFPAIDHNGNTVGYLTVKGVNHGI